LKNYLFIYEKVQLGNIPPYAGCTFFVHFQAHRCNFNVLIVTSLKLVQLCIFFLEPFPMNSWGISAHDKSDGMQVITSCNHTYPAAFNKHSKNPSMSW